MKFCKRETFLYWCVHCFIWIVIALPTLVFLLRISHPIHPTTAKLNDSKSGEPTSSTKHDICYNDTKHSCIIFGIENDYSQGNTGVTDDEEIRHILTNVNFTHSYSLCKKLLRDVLCVQKYSRCTIPQNNAAKRKSDVEQRQLLADQQFCENCSILSRPRKNVLPQIDRYSWFENLSCLSLDNLFKGKRDENETSERNTCHYPLIKDENTTCRVPCDWSLLSHSVRQTIYVVMVLNMWAALIASVITMATLASFQPMRTFPHIVRFYILICSALYATASLLPLRVGLAKVYCEKEKYWHPDGLTTRSTIIEGVTTQYFFLGFCFWSLVYVINTYSVIVKHTQHIFDYKTKNHVIQFSICGILPALLVAINVLAKPPGYKSLYLDQMTSAYASPLLEYLTFVLPVQISLGGAVSLLWSVIRFVRKVRKENTTIQVIRPEEDVQRFINAERQFSKLAVFFVITVAVVLSSEAVITYKHEEYLHEVEEYFDCLKVSANCSKPDAQIFFLSTIKIIVPGFYCLLNFFLLFLNKDTRNVWKKWLRLCYSAFRCRWNRVRGKDSTDSNARRMSLQNQTLRSRSCTMESLGSLSKVSTLGVGKVSIAPDGKNTLQDQMSMTAFLPSQNDPDSYG